MGPREFQLVLLRRMADFQPQLVDQARRELDASRTEMREVNARWQAMLRSARAPAGLRRYETVLGPAHSTGKRTLGDLACAVHRWPVPLWPELRYEVVTLPEGALLHEWLVRAEDAPAPEPHAVDDLVPWSCVVEDVARAFAPAVPMEGTAPARWRLAFTASEAAGDHRTYSYTADFTWGLLQLVTRVGESRGGGADDR
ncbi:hypothetical protein [Streptomonospora litoralis]|nr:hypothetical protein [Streptomonospora litoralis]